jgi:hypothetical protein
LPSFNFLSSTAAKLVIESALDNYGRPGSTGLFGDLGDLDGDGCFASPVTNQNMAACCRSGLWLLHNELDRSHSISQDIETPEGSYWHGIMHRMEGDFGNSKYWFRRVGQHGVFETLNQQLPGGFDPYDFVDQCEAAASNEDQFANCHKIAVAEWVALFEFCGTRI